MTPGPASARVVCRALIDFAGVGLGASGCVLDLFSEELVEIVRRLAHLAVIQFASEGFKGVLKRRPVELRDPPSNPRPCACVSELWRQEGQEPLGPPSCFLVSVERGGAE